MAGLSIVCNSHWFLQNHEELTDNMYKSCKRQHWTYYPAQMVKETLRVVHVTSFFSIMLSQNCDTCTIFGKCSGSESDMKWLHGSLMATFM